MPKIWTISNVYFLLINKGLFTKINKFYKNNGDMNFIDISETIGLFQNNHSTFGASFADIDNDGDLDVFISNRDSENHNYLYRNDSGVYTDVTYSSGISLDSQFSFCSIIVDFNRDGFQDIYIANDKPQNINRLYKNSLISGHTEAKF